MITTQRESNNGREPSIDETYKVEVASPLLQPGLSISIEVNKIYVTRAVSNIMQMVNTINNTASEEVQRLRMALQAQIQSAQKFAEQIEHKDFEIKELQEKLATALEVPAKIDDKAEIAETLEDLNSEKDPNYREDEDEDEVLRDIDNQS
jgi:ABC-type transporter Mla subunit MlaD